MEPGHVINHVPTLTHAWERMFGIIVYHYGQIIFPVNIQSLNIFHPQYYIAKYVDLPAHGITSNAQALEHYINYGYMEGRTGNLMKEFDYEDYRKNVLIYDMKE